MTLCEYCNCSRQRAPCREVTYDRSGHQSSLPAALTAQLRAALRSGGNDRRAESVSKIYHAATDPEWAIYLATMSAVEPRYRDDPERVAAWELVRAHRLLLYSQPSTHRCDYLNERNATERRRAEQIVRAAGLTYNEALARHHAAAAAVRAPLERARTEARARLYQTVVPALRWREAA